MVNIIKKVWNAVATLIVVVVVIFAILVVGVRIFGVDVFVVLSGSMEPEFMTGSVIYVTKVDTSTLKENDVITYKLTEKTIATHRIIEVFEEDGVVKYRTKGDNNEIEDEVPVLPQQVVGTPIFTIPYIGYIISYIQNPPGTYVAISVGAVLLLILVLPDLLFEEEKKKDDTDSTKQPENSADKPDKASKKEEETV